MPLGAGLVATGRVVLSVEDGQLHSGLIGAERKVAESTGRMQKSVAELTDAQLKAEIAQTKYTRAVERFGPESLQAAQATLKLRSAQRELAAETERGHGILGRFRSHVRDAEGEVGTLGRGTLAASGAFSHFGRSLAFASGAFLGAAGFVSVLKDSIGAASQLQGQMERTDALFGQSAGTIKAWSEGTAASMGIARTEALQMAGSFGNMLVPMGIAPARAAGMSTALVKLSADMAAFTHSSPEEMLKVLEQGLAGRGRSLIRFGVEINKTTLLAQALGSGLVKASSDMGAISDAQSKVQIATERLTEAVGKHGAQSVQAAAATLTLHRAESGLEKATAGHVPTLNAAQKAMAAYQIIMHSTALEQGFFSAHSADLAEQQQKLKADVSNLKEEIGTALLPTVLKIVTALTGWLEHAQKTGEIQRALKTATEDVKAVVSATWPVIQSMAHALKAVVDAVGGWKKAFEIVLSGLLATKIYGLAKAFGVLGGAAGIGGAEAAAGGLLLSLGRLAKLGAISIPITLAVTYAGALADTGPAKGLRGIANKISDFLHIPQGYLPFSGAATTPGGGQPAAYAPTQFLSPSQKRAYIAQRARFLGLDPAAMLAIATSEGGGSFSGEIGDSGHAFGPFQLNNAGGVITGRFPGRGSPAAQAFANSPQGIDLALGAIAQQGRGLRGEAAIIAAIQFFERDQDYLDGLKRGLSPAQAARQTSAYRRAMQAYGLAGAPIPQPTGGGPIPQPTGGGGGAGEAGGGGRTQRPRRDFTDKRGTSSLSPTDLTYAERVALAQAQSPAADERVRRGILGRLERTHARPGTELAANLAEAIRSERDAIRQIEDARRQALKQEHTKTAALLKQDQRAATLAVKQEHADVAASVKALFRVTDDEAKAAALARKQTEHAATLAVKQEHADVAASVKALFKDQEAAAKAAFDKVLALVASRRASFATAFGSLAQGALAAFDAQTRKGLDALDKGLREKLRLIQAGFGMVVERIDSQLAGQLAGLAKTSKDALAGIEQRLADSLQQIESARAELTPAEQQLADMAEQRASGGRERAMRDAAGRLDKAQEALAKAKGGGDKELIEQAEREQLNAEQAFKDAQYEIDRVALEKQALLERRAKDKQASADAKAAQDQAERDRQAKQDQFERDRGYAEKLAEAERQDAQNKADLQAASAQEEFDRLKLNFESERTLERGHFEMRLSELEKFLETRGGSIDAANEAVKKAFADFGLDPTFAQAGLDLGTGFAKGLRESVSAIDTAVAAVNEALARLKGAGGTSPPAGRPPDDRGGPSIGDLLPPPTPSIGDLLPTLAASPTLQAVRPGLDQVAEEWRRGGLGGANVTVVNHFAAPPPDPHLFSHSLGFELRAMG